MQRSRCLRFIGLWRKDLWIASVRADHHESEVFPEFRRLVAVGEDMKGGDPLERASLCPGAPELFLRTVQKSRHRELDHDDSDEDGEGEALARDCR